MMGMLRMSDFRSNGCLIVFLLEIYCTCTRLESTIKVIIYYLYLLVLQITMAINTS